MCACVCVLCCGVWGEKRRVINLIVLSLIFNESAQSIGACICVYYVVPIFTADLTGCRAGAMNNVLLFRYCVSAGDSCRVT